MENSELKTKKMSLANIEGKLSVTEMEQIMAGSGGWGCVWSSVGLAASVAGFAFVTGGAGLVVAMVGYSASVGGMVTSC